MAWVLCLTACGRPAPIQPKSTPTGPGPGTVGITANGTLAPARRLALSFGVEGFVETVAVEVGEHVEAGQTLVTLHDTELKRAVAEAEIDLESAQARVAQLEAQATPVPERVLAATAAITSAREALTQARVQAGQRNNQDIIDRRELQQAADALQDAREEYQKVLDDPRTTTWAPSSPQARDLDDAQEHYDVVLARYEMRVADHAYAVAIADAEARVAQAQLTLYEAQHPVRPEEIAPAQLDLERAQLALEAARMDLAGATLAAPFDGVVAHAPVSVGQWAAPGATVVELLDLSGWRIETNNVGELEIARVRVGQEVRVRVNAFRDETLRGRVATVSPVAVVQQGDTTYTLTIELEPTQLNLRPGMTVQVEILTE
jgi:HlyD family secretion protein